MGLYKFSLPTTLSLVANSLGLPSLFSKKNLQLLGRSFIFSLFIINKLIENNIEL